MRSSRVLVMIAAFLSVALANAAADPTTERLVALREEANDAGIRGTLPVRLIQEISAWQPSPLYLVLDEREPEDPDRYAMTHPVTALEWPDGRLLVVDVGMPPADAVAFGGPADWLGADAMECNPRAWTPLRAEGRRIEAILFTHLHVDHTMGVRELCKGDKVPIRLSPEQEASDERFEAEGREWLEATASDCVERDAWSVTGVGTAVEALGGFPGAYRVPVPGHTPGSQIVVAFLASPGQPARGVVIAGDIVNHRLGFERDVDKPFWYRWLIVREDAEQQTERRALLRALDAAGFEILVSHDLPGAESGLPKGQCPDSDP